MSTTMQSNQNFSSVAQDELDIDYNFLKETSSPLSNPINISLKRDNSKQLDIKLTEVVDLYHSEINSAHLPANKDSNQIENDLKFNENAIKTSHSIFKDDEEKYDPNLFIRDNVKEKNTKYTTHHISALETKTMTEMSINSSNFFQDEAQTFDFDDTIRLEKVHTVDVVNQSKDGFAEVEHLKLGKGALRQCRRDSITDSQGSPTSPMDDSFDNIGTFKRSNVIGGNSLKLIKKQRITRNRAKLISENSFQQELVNEKLENSDFSQTSLASNNADPDSKTANRSFKKQKKNSEPGISSEDEDIVVSESDTPEISTFKTEFQRAKTEANLLKNCLKNIVNKYCDIRCQELDLEIEQLERDVHPDYLKLLNEIEGHKNDSLKKNLLSRELNIRAAEEKFLADTELERSTYKATRRLARQKIFNQVTRSKYKLKYELDKLTDLIASPNYSASNLGNKRKLSLEFYKTAKGNFLSSWSRRVINEKGKVRISGKQAEFLVPDGCVGLNDSEKREDLEFFNLLRI
ncbi:hypothetical protein HK099_000643 [Clydaea vesicula]|uniref:Uncharacterized protein n=1 Tax=Clydaea vesicula TaxID=447962 RepID=A0AAD5U5Q3_9FUNG|nr:hypothetical protein HK099_000643 [Clydaea vesicula]